VGNVHGVDILNVVGPLIIPAFVVKRTIKYYNLFNMTYTIAIGLADEDTQCD
jgi:hypothetical protein